MTRRTTGTLTAGSARQSKKGTPTNGAKSKATSKTAMNTSADSENAATDKANHKEADVLLKEDHRKVEKLFKAYESTQDVKGKKKLSNQICMELIVHTQVEEELFYPACREHGVVDSLLDEAQVEHDGAKVLITQLVLLPADSDYFDAKVKVLSEYIKHHVGEEEKPTDGLFAKARSAGVDMAALGRQLASRKEEMMEQGEDRILQPPIPCSLQAPDFINPLFKENQAMANQQTRDDQGRFSSEGQRSSSSGRYQSNDQDDDYSSDNRSGRGSSSQQGNRDDYGRFSSGSNRGGGGSDRSQHDDTSRYGGGRSGQHYGDDDDDNYSRGQHRGSSQGQGWHGDSEGHSQAARQGRGGGGYSDDRDDYRSSGNYGGYDDQGRGQQSYGRSGGNYRNDRDDDRNYGGRYDQGSGRQSSGRSDRDDYRSSSNYGDRNDQGRGQSGWFGDPEGHAEAARRGHQSSGRSDRDDRGEHSRSGSGSSHGGWFGDSSGHAEAARQGWKNR